MAASISAIELDVLSEWLENTGNKKIFNEYIKINYAIRHNMNQYDAEQTKKIIAKKIKNDRRRFNFQIISKYAAVIVLLISMPFVYKYYDNDVEAIIEPGTNKAILSLEDGKQIFLEKGKEYHYQNRVSNGEELVYRETSSGKELKYNYLTIPRGGRFFIHLSDGTKVWLNSETKLKYPVSFIKGQPREVELVYGEAYFDVSHSTLHNGDAFKVHTQIQNIEVLGTEFNIKAYQNEESLYTTLIKGRVAIDNGILSKFLNSGQQAIVNIQNEQLKIIDGIDTTPEIAWKNNFFMFDKQKLGSMMKTLSRWYDIEVVFENEEAKNIIFSGILSREYNIEELLENIEKTNEVHFKIDNKKITIQ
ncbi:FecR family protein [Aquimarina sp. I32.4]|uniref:FecR family protein n=1 Tax=Aquimarina sp. I32.4 TaxID=2053903 RepID=UPI0013047DB1|nr:FecR family protein [Aquimarina sp. I32.4]